MDYIKEIEGAYIAPNATVMGDVSIGEGSCIWYGSVVRGDESSIRIGDRTNIQDNCVVHTDSAHTVEIGNDVTVGHGCILHGCSVGDGTMVGMGSIILNGAKIGKQCLIGAGSLVTGKLKVPDGSLVMGNPAKVKGALTDTEKNSCLKNAAVYVEEAKKHFG